MARLDQTLNDASNSHSVSACGLRGMETAQSGTANRPLTPWRVASVIGMVFSALSIVGLFRGTFSVGLVSVFRTIQDFYETALQSVFGWWLGPIMANIARNLDVSVNPSWKHLLVVATIWISIGARILVAAIRLRDPFARMRGKGALYIRVIVAHAALFVMLGIAALTATMKTGGVFLEASLWALPLSAVAAGYHYFTYVFSLRHEPLVRALATPFASSLVIVAGAGLFVLLNAGLAYFSVE